MKTAIKICSILLIVTALLMIVSFFLPYASATKERREWIQEHPDYMYAPEINMTYNDAKDISLIECFKIYSYGVSNTTGYSQGASVISVVLLWIMAIFTALIALFNFIKKPVPSLVFSALLFGISYLFGWDLKSRGIIGTGEYNSGFAYYVMIIIPIIIFALDIVLLILRGKKKRAEKNSKAEATAGVAE